MTLNLAREPVTAPRSRIVDASPDQSAFRLTPPPAARTQMTVTKRSGERELVDVNKIVRAVMRCCDGLSDVDPMCVALKTIAGLYDGATTRELDELSIRTAASFMFEEPGYSRLAGTNWVFRDESAHMAFAFEVLGTVRREEPHLFDPQWAAQVTQMIEEAVECESQFAEDVLAGGVIGLTRSEMRQYLEYVADQRFTMLGLPTRYQARNPFPFMQLQDVQELTNFFERRVSAYQVAVQGEICFDAQF